MVNTHWGDVTEDNSFGTHEFMDLCAQIGCEPYVTGNVGSGTVRELSQWVEYMNNSGESPMVGLRKKNGHEAPFNVKFWGIGNENWGCGGNMRPEFYADQFRRYATYVRDYSGRSESGACHPFKIACGPNTDNYQWTETLMEEASQFMDGLSLHYYTVPGPWEAKGSAINYSEGEYAITMKQALRMDELVRRHGAIMDKKDPARRIALVVDEWGTWFDVEPGTNPGFLYQQSTMRDAMVAGVTLNIFNNYAERVRIANIAQTINVLQAVILTEGAKMILTPTYHVFDMYKVHQDAVKLPVYVECDSWDGMPAISASASMDSADRTHVSLCNIDPKEEKEVSLEMHVPAGTKVSGEILNSGDMHDHNTFEKDNIVNPKPFNGACVKGSKVIVKLPPLSIVTLEIV
jgi:alpha-N-arabinofuranosidase